MKIPFSNPPKSSVLLINKTSDFLQNVHDLYVFDIEELF